MPCVDEEMIDRLLSLNRAFYAAFAEHFAASRSIRDPALTAILPYLPSRARILDVGCGSGRLAALLDQERPGCSYVGVDPVPELIEVARLEARGLLHTEATFSVLDVTEEEWVERLPAASSRSPARDAFDCVVALAVLHHIPDFGLRAQVLGDMARVLKPDGCLLVSTWRFLAHERMRKKIVEWDAVGIDEEDLDPGDYLLDWKRGGRGLRYCHAIDEEEMAALAAVNNLTLREAFCAGGKERDLSLFAVLDRGA